MKNYQNNFIVSNLGILAILAFGFMAIVPTALAADNYGWRYTGDSSYDKYRTEINYNDRNPNPRPIIYSLNPNPVVVGSGATTISINGDNFVYGAVAKINNVDRTTSFVGTRKLSVELTGLDTAYLGDYVITVYNPGPGGGFSNGYIFRVTYRMPTATASVSTGTVAGASASKTPTSTTSTKKTEVKTETTDENYSDLTAGAIFGSDGFLPKGLIQWLIFAILVLLLVIIGRRIFGAEKYHRTPLKHA